jgi:peptidoglycan/LPS O-acetylase OafA/YrhL
MNSKPSIFYKPELDILRFMAFFFVFLHHIFPTSSDLYLKYSLSVSQAHLAASLVDSFKNGLSIFFFLSAYLIASLLMNEFRIYGHIDMKSFYIRRILRIWPLYFVGLLVGVIFAYWRYPDQLPMFKYFSIFIGNLYFHSHHFTGGLMEHLWSISVEEQFYVLFPILLGMFGSLFCLPIGIFFLIVSMAALIFYGTTYLPGDEAIWTNTLCQFIFFGAGIICASITFKHEFHFKSFTRVIFVLLSFIFIFIPPLFQLRTAPSGVETLLSHLFTAIGCVLFLFSLLNIPYPFPKFLIYLGKISYGLYVWHRVGIFMVGHFIRHNSLVELLGLIPTILLAALSYHFLELPFLRLKNKFTHVLNRPL